MYSGKPWNRAAGDLMRNMDQFVKLSDQFKGRYVVGTNGERVGQINDVRSTPGPTVGYDLSQVLIEALADTKHILSLTYSLGKMCDR
jgi:hypothetical protein